MPLDLSGKADLKWLSALIADVRGAAPGASFILAGAAARDVILKHGHDVDTGRATLDVDLAFAVENWDAYETLRKALLDSTRFTKERNEHHCVRHTGAGKSRVDLIPFAGVEDDKRMIAWPPDGAHIMNMVGFREAADCAETIVLPDGHSIAVASLPAQILLKLAAWKDRRLLVPGKDAQDIRLLLRNYLDAGNRERLYAEAQHLLEKDDFEYESASAWLLGHDAREITTVESAPAGSHDYFWAILDEELSAKSDSMLIGDMNVGDPLSNLRLLESFGSAFSNG